MNIWTRLGISVAIHAGFYIFMTEVLQKTRQFETHKWLWTLALLISGFVVWLFGMIPNRAAIVVGTLPAPGTAPLQGEEPSETSESPLFSLRYCGCMLMIFGVITVVIVPSSRTRVMAAARSMTVRTHAPQDRASHGVPGKGALPPLKLQGIIFKVSNPRR